jgi:thioredoxin reductase (NADPH)
MSAMTDQAEAARTAILTVDDDPGVSRAVARDLRRRYGEQHRIVRAESAPGALDALRHWPNTPNKGCATPHSAA